MKNEASLVERDVPTAVRAGTRPGNGSGSHTATASSDLEILRQVFEGTAGSTGEEFFKDLVRHLTSALGVPFAAISEFAGVNTRVRTLAFWARGNIQENFEYDLAGTPREEVVQGRLCHYPSGVTGRFPRARPLVQLGVESYLGTPLLDAEGKPLGLLAVFDDRPVTASPRHLYLLRLFAARVGAAHGAAARRAAGKRQRAPLSRSL